LTKCSPAICHGKEARHRKSCERSSTMRRATCANFGPTWKTMLSHLCRRQSNATPTNASKPLGSSATPWQSFRDIGNLRTERGCPALRKHTTFSTAVQGDHAMTRWKRRAGLLLALGFALLPLCGGWAGDKKSADKNEYYKGKVVPLAELLAKSNVKIDADAAPYLLVLQADDGKLYPLLKDDGSRMFFKDARLLNRPMRLPP